MLKRCLLACMPCRPGCSETTFETNRIDAVDLGPRCWKGVGKCWKGDCLVLERCLPACMHALQTWVLRNSNF